MMNQTPAPAPLRNKLLAKLSASELQGIVPHLQLVSLERDETLYEAGGPIDTVYFPEGCVFSALHVMENAGAIEVGTVGNEGVSGLSVLIGMPISLDRVVTQIPGSGLRLSADVLGREASQDGPLRTRMLNYQTYFYARVSQSVACNGLHPIQERCCRWLLMTHDRLDSDIVPLTHEYLSMMLGVRRASVTEVLQSLQEHGVIDTSRGKITVTNREGLEDLSCECYRNVRHVYEQLLG